MPEERDRPDNEGVEEAVRSEGAESRGAAAGTPKIGEDAVKGQTAAPAASDDVGVPSDEEISQEEEEARTEDEETHREQAQD